MTRKRTQPSNPHFPARRGPKREDIVTLCPRGFVLGTAFVELHGLSAGDTVRLFFQLETGQVWMSFGDPKDPGLRLQPYGSRGRNLVANCGNFAKMHGFSLATRRIPVEEDGDFVVFRP